MAERGALERAHVKAELVRHLAAGGQTKTQLGRRYGVTHQAVSEFATRHAAEIARVKAVLVETADTEFAHLWVAEKAARIATYQSQIDYVADLLGGDQYELERKAGVNVSTAELVRTAQTALKSVAEELGQLPNRTTVQHEGGVSVRYEIVGVSMDALT